MGSSQSTPNGSCRHCGAELIAGRSECWLCHASMPAGGDAAIIVAEAAGNRQAARPTGRFQFGISSILLFTTFVAILCSITTMSPGLGVALAILAIPALLRTYVVAARRGASGKPMSTGGKAGVFLLTLFVVVGAIVAVLGAFVVAFLATCAVTGGDRGFDGSLPLALLFGGVAAIATIVVIVLTLVAASRRRGRKG
jgi:hypothetical protein